MTTMANDVTGVAEQILSVLPAGSVVRACSDDRRTIRYAVRAASAKLRAVILSKVSLRKLLRDPQRDVKIEYLQRDLLRSIDRRIEFRYPHAGQAGPCEAQPAVAMSV